MKILVVEDEKKIADALQEGLRQEAFAVDVAYDGDEGLNAALHESYDLIILDVMLPGTDGYEICRKLRLAHNNTPVLMLTARDQNSDIVQGLELGADDYLVKPFSFEILLARVRALLRRPHENQGDILQVRDFTLNTVTKEAERGNKPIALSTKEYSLLEYLMRNKNKVLSKDDIMWHVWDFDADILPNTVEVFVAYLRAKVDKPFKGPALIKTVRGFGYIIKD